MLLAVPVYYAVCCVLAAVFSTLSGEVRLVDLPASIGVMFIIGWLQMILAVEDRSFFGSPEPMQWAMVIGLFLTPVVLRYLARRPPSPFRW